MTSGWPVKFPQELRPIDRWKVGQPTATRYPPDGTPTLKNSTKSISTDPGRPEIDAEYPLETQAELEECLETYRTKMVPYFPVLCIDTETTMGELIKERPFLHLVIRTICSKNLQRQAVLVLQVKEVLGREVLLGGKKNLDLFLGVLVFEAWSHLYIYNKPINSTVIQLGISLAFDLGLTRPLSGNPVNPMLNYISQGRPTPVNGTTLARTIEERRAVVGLYLISSM
jgi:hypothetical protein